MCFLCVLNSGDPTDTAGLEVLIHEQTQLPQVPICNYKMKLCWALIVLDTKWNSTSHASHVPKIAMV